MTSPTPTRVPWGVFKLTKAYYWTNKVLAFFKYKLHIDPIPSPNPPTQYDVFIEDLRGG